NELTNLKLSASFSEEDIVEIKKHCPKLTNFQHASWPVAVSTDKSKPGRTPLTVKTNKFTLFQSKVLLPGVKTSSVPASPREPENQINSAKELLTLLFTPTPKTPSSTKPTQSTTKPSMSSKSSNWVHIMGNRKASIPIVKQNSEVNQLTQQPAQQPQ